MQSILTSASIHRLDQSFNPPFACKRGLLLFVGVDEYWQAFTNLIAAAIAAQQLHPVCVLEIRSSEGIKSSDVEPTK